MLVEVWLDKIQLSSLTAISYLPRAESVECAPMTELLNSRPIVANPAPGRELNRVPNEGSTPSEL